MKRNSSLAKIILAAVFFQSQFVIADDNYGQQTNTDVNVSAELQSLVCKKVPSPNWNENNGGERPQVDDPACVAENNRRAQLRVNAAGVQAQTNRLSTGDGTQLVAPKAPAYNCGSMEPFSSEFQACKNSYNAANAQYQKDLGVYNQAQTATGAAQNQAELKAIEDQKNKTATATLAEIKDKNDQGKKSYDGTAKTTMALGMAALAAGTACASSCPSGCCGAAPAFFATAAAMFLLNSKAKKQSAEHAKSSANACQSLNQLSSQASNCSAPTTNVSTTGTTTISYDPVTGKCLPEGSEECKQLPGVTAAAPAVRDALKTSGFAVGKNLDDQYKMLPDGSVQMKNGKIYKDGDFKDINAMIALGLSPSAAKGVMDSLSQASGGLAGLGLDSKAAKKEYKDNLGGALGGADGTTTVVNVNRAQNSDQKYSDDLGAKGDGKKLEEDRKPSSEGLAKEFNGELIGVAGDDIFLMMNRRYKLKNEQDSFIAQDLK
ncbi:MAG: hypothetical protein V4654_07260 [Bdellovibrionota bacterium]